MNTQTIYKEYQANTIMHFVFRWDPTRGVHTQFYDTKPDTLNTPEGEDWIPATISLLQDEGINTRCGRSNTVPYVQILGGGAVTDCRSKGMKRIGIYKDGEEIHLATWGITATGKSELKTWIERIKSVCVEERGWKVMTNVKGSGKMDGEVGFTSRRLIVNGMKKKKLCGIIKELIS